MKKKKDLGLVNLTFLVNKEECPITIIILKKKR